MKTPKITMRYGASHNDITVDGHRFDRADLNRSTHPTGVSNLQFVIDEVVKVLFPHVLWWRRYHHA